MEEDRNSIIVEESPEKTIGKSSIRPDSSDSNESKVSIVEHRKLIEQKRVIFAGEKPVRQNTCEKKRQSVMQILLSPSKYERNLGGDNFSKRNSISPSKNERRQSIMKTILPIAGIKSNVTKSAIRRVSRIMDLQNFKIQEMLEIKEAQEGQFPERANFTHNLAVTLRERELNNLKTQANLIKQVVDNPKKQSCGIEYGEIGKSIDQSSGSKTVDPISAIMQINNQSEKKPKPKLKMIESENLMRPNPIEKSYRDLNTNVKKKQEILELNPLSLLNNPDKSQVSKVENSLTKSTVIYNDVNTQGNQGITKSGDNKSIYQCESQYQNEICLDVEKVSNTDGNKSIIKCEPIKEEHAIKNKTKKVVPTKPRNSIISRASELNKDTNPNSYLKKSDEQYFSDQDDSIDSKNMNIKPDNYKLTNRFIHELENYINSTKKKDYFMSLEINKLQNLSQQASTEKKKQIYLTGLIDTFVLQLTQVLEMKKGNKQQVIFNRWEQNNCDYLTERTPIKIDIKDKGVIDEKVKGFKKNDSLYLDRYHHKFEMIHSKSNERNLDNITSRNSLLDSPKSAVQEYLYADYKSSRSTTKKYHRRKDEIIYNLKDFLQDYNDGSHSAEIRNNRWLPNLNSSYRGLKTNDHSFINKPSKLRAFNLEKNRKMELQYPAELIGERRTLQKPYFIGNTVINGNCGQKEKFYYTSRKKVPKKFLSDVDKKDISINDYFLVNAINNSSKYNNTVYGPYCN